MSDSRTIDTSTNDDARRSSELETNAAVLVGNVPTIADGAGGDEIGENGNTGNVGAVLSSGAPEPATWIMMLFGVGLAGTALRLAQQKNALAITG